MRMPFKDLPIGKDFHLNGNIWRKRSNRTAVLIEPKHVAGAWFYFKQAETVEAVTRESRHED